MRAVASRTLLSSMFLQSEYPAAFRRTKRALKGSMLRLPLPANSQAFRWRTENQGGRTLKAKFISENFEKVEVDCLVKVCVHDPARIVWGDEDPSVTEAVGVRLQLLDARVSGMFAPVSAPVSLAILPPSPAAAPRLPSGIEAEAAPTTASIPTGKSAARRRRKAAAAKGAAALYSVVRKQP